MNQKLGLPSSSRKVAPMPVRSGAGMPGGSDHPRGGSLTVNSTTTA